MKSSRLLLAAMLVLLQPTPSFAGDPVTIPIETHKSMKRGKKLDLVWIAPGFDGTKGVRLGPITNDSEDNATIVIERFPGALRRFIHGDSPYTLHLAVVQVRMSTAPNGNSSAKVEVEGRVMDATGTLVAAFETSVKSTIGGNERDNARYAVDGIAFDMAKDLFTSALPTIGKEPAVIVAAPSPVIVAPTPAPQAVPASPVATPNIQPAAPVVPSIQPEAGVQPPPQVAIPQPSSQEAPKTPAPPPSKPAAAVPAAPEPAVAPLPDSITRSMKNSKALGQIWTSPAYDRSRGFEIGEVRYLVEGRNSGVGQYLPEALSELVKKGSPYLLQLYIVELRERVTSKTISTLKLGVEGRLITKDGTIVAAFKTRETITGTGDLVEDGRTATRKVVLAIQKDLL